MLRYSLIIATVGRRKELQDFFSSLELQNYPDYELILVDQNPPEFLEQLLSEWKGRINILHIRSKLGVARARNEGLRHATGSVITFPDDDCWYSPDLLQSVADWLTDNRKYGFLAVGVEDSYGVPSGNRWFQSCCDISKANAFRTTMTPSLFFRSEIIAGTSVTFDESIGPGSGTRIGCGEDTDFVLKILATGAKGRFDRTLKVGHPRRDAFSGGVTRERVHGYGIGMGYVLKKHSYRFLAIVFVAYDCLRGLAAFATGRLNAARLCFAHGKGVMNGFAFAGKALKERCV